MTTRPSEARFTQLDVVPNALVIVGADHRIVAANVAACEVFGYSADELVGESLDVLLPAGVAGRHHHHLDRVVSGAVDARAMSRLRTVKGRRRNGDEFDAEIHVGTTEADGAPLFAASIRDVSTERQTVEALGAATRRLNGLVKNASDGIVVFDAMGRIDYASPYFRELTGHCGAGDAATLRYELIHPDDLPAATDAARRVLRSPGATAVVETRVRNHDQRWTWVESTLTNQLDDPDVRGIVSNFRNISDRKLADGQREAVARLGMEALSGCDFDQLATTASNLLSEFLGADGAAVLEHPAADGPELVVRSGDGWLRSTVGHSIPAPATSPAHRVLTQAEPVIVGDFLTEDWFPSLDDLEAQGIRSSIGVAIEGPGRPWGIVFALSTAPDVFGPADASFVRSIANVLATALERDRAHTTLSHQAMHDPLTGLANRSLIVDRIEQALVAARASGDTDVVVQFLDLDHFKQVNDSFGHSVGDELLCEVARRLQAAVREDDTVGRFGGDEFVIVTRQRRNKDYLGSLVQRAQEAMLPPCRIGGRDFFVTASMGIAVSSTRSDDSASLLRDADSAMFQAKRDGRNRCEVFAQGVRVELLKRTTTERELRAAIDGDQFVCHFQPVVDCTTGRVVSLEALVRWAHPVRGLVPPAEFIAVAEDTHLIIPMGRWMIRTASAQLAAWQRQHGLDCLTMSVNLSPRQLVDPELIDCIGTTLDELALPARSLKLEITETAVIDNLARAQRALHTIADLGVGIVLDDFGTGYSSLGYVKQLPIDCIKVDRSFIVDICHNPTDRAIVAAVSALANQLGISAIAEGVENVDQLQNVRDLGCTLIQGYHYSRPVPADDAALAGLLVHGAPTEVGSPG